MTLIDRPTIARLADRPTREIAARLSVSERTVQRALSELRASGIPVAHGRERGVTRAEIEHGSETKYRYGCHCQPCRDANAERMRTLRAERKQRGLPPDDPRHGTVNGATNWGCRCPDCRAADTARKREQAARRAEKSRIAL